MIEFKNVSKKLADKSVLNHLSFSVRRGEIVFLLGQSGVGKSVTLRHLVGLMRPDSGQIWVDGREISQLTEEEFLAVRRKCGLVFQFPALLDTLTVYENVAFGVRALQVCPPEEEKNWILENLKRVHVPSQWLNAFPSQLSFGLQKKVSIARTLAIHPTYLLFDEPTTSLDPVSTRVVHELIRNLCRQLHISALVVSHNIQGALEYADKILFLEGGTIVAEGTPDQIRVHPHPRVQAFIKWGTL